LLDDGIAFANEREHVSAEKEFFGQEAKDGRRRGYSEVIGHLGRAGGERAEVVVGLHGAEDSFIHGHLEVAWRINCRDFVGEVVPEAEVFGSPGDLVGEVLEAGGEAAYCEGLFVEVYVSEEMDFYAAGEVEAALNGGFDRRGLIDANHRVKSSLLARVNVLSEALSVDERSSYSRKFLRFLKLAN
jgi:hypothetical protein